MKKLSAPIFARPKNILDYCFQVVYRANINEKLCKKNEQSSLEWSNVLIFLARPKTLSTFFARRFLERFEVKQTPFQGTVYDGVED